MKYIFVFIFVLFPQFSFSQDNKAPSGDVSSQKYWKYNGIGIGIITAWGLAHWDYFSQAPKSQSEGWFGQDTNYGGADKLGHMYSAYTLSHFLAYQFSEDGVISNQSAYYAVLSSCLILGYMEFGDSFSSFGFSPQDLMANMVGCALGYVHLVYPSIAEKFDLRWEYGFHPNQVDILTDYDNSKFLLVTKLNGFQNLNHNYSRYLEIQLGYYTRGYLEKNERDERYAYLGLGLNLSQLLEERSYSKAASVFRYLQMPYTYFSKNQNRSQ